MARLRLLSLPLVALALGACTRPPAPELIVHGASFHTLDPSLPLATAVAIRGGRFVAVGRAEEVRELAGTSTAIRDLGGAHAYPGFTDAHMHLFEVGQRELEFDLTGTTSAADLAARVAARVASTPQGGWIVGRGWIETHWPERRFPDRADLDAVAPQHPVWLERSDGHAWVANSRALEVAGVTRATEAPAGGEVLRDARGEPTGMFIDNARSLVERHIVRTEPELEATLRAGIARSQRMGWTGVQDAGIDERGRIGRIVEAMRRLCADGQLGLRWYAAVGAPSPDAERLIADGPSIGECDGRITLRALKFYMDGALGSRGAALLAPYGDAPGDGLLRNPPELLAGWYARARDAGIQVATHAIGDRGNRIVLDLYQAALAGRPPGADRWRIEHAQVLAPEDLPRFAALGVIPAMQPSHAIGDLFFAPARLGMERLAGAYAWRSLIGSGAIVAAGSDAPVEQGDPRIEFYAAVARRSLDGQQLAGWHPEQAMTRDEALRALTLWPAYAAFEERERGSIEVGKRADLTAFDRDLLTVPEREVLAAEVVLTMVGGGVAFGRR
jgi:hypothetical protein